jgi:hypothetical protein
VIPICGSSWDIQCTTRLVAHGRAIPNLCCIWVATHCNTQEPPIDNDCLRSARDSSVGGGVAKLSDYELRSIFRFGRVLFSCFKCSTILYFFAAGSSFTNWDVLHIGQRAMLYFTTNAWTNTPLPLQCDAILSSLTERGRGLPSGSHSPPKVRRGSGKQVILCMARGSLWPRDASGFGVPGGEV